LELRSVRIRAEEKLERRIRRKETGILWRILSHGKLEGRKMHDLIKGSFGNT
jgi:hypothetical protein